MTFSKKHEKLIWMIVAFVVTIFVLMSCSYFVNLEDLREYFSPMYGFLTSICVFFYLTPPWFSMLGIPLVAFIYMTRRPFEKRQGWIIAVSVILSVCTVASQAFVQSHTLYALYQNPLNVAFTLIALASFAAFAFLLLRPAFYAMEKFAGKWFGDGTSAKKKVRVIRKQKDANSAEAAGVAEDTEGTSQEVRASGSESESRTVQAGKPEAAGASANAGRKRSGILAAPAFKMPPWAFVLIACGMLFCWLPYIIGFAPGYINIDLTAQLLQFDGIFPFSNASPLVATGIYGTVYSLGSAIGGDDWGLFALVLMQTIALLAALTYELYIIYRLCAPKWVVVVAACFFALSPIFGSLAAYGTQDILHGALFAVYVSLFILYIKSPSEFSHSVKWMAALIVFAMLTGLTRNNAFFVVLLSLPFLALFHLGWKAKLIALVPLVLTVVCIYGINTGLLYALDAKPSAGVASATSAMRQQIGRYARDYPDDIEEWEYEALNKYFEYDKLAEAYKWEVQDDVGRLIREDADDSGLWAAWLSLGLRHPTTYLDAFGELTYGYWSVQSVVDYERESFGSEQLDFVRNGTEKMHDWHYWSTRSVRQNADDLQEALLGLPFLSFTSQGGFYTWIALIGVAFLCFCKKKRYAVVFLPILIVMLTLIAGPRNNTLRYFFCVVCATPVSMWATLYFAAFKREIPRLTRTPSSH